MLQTNEGGRFRLLLKKLMVNNPASLLLLPRVWSKGYEFGVWWAYSKRLKCMTKQQCLRDIVSMWGGFFKKKYILVGIWTNKTFPSQNLNLVGGIDTCSKSDIIEQFFFFFFGGDICRWALYYHCWSYWFLCNDGSILPLPYIPDENLSRVID